MRTRSRLFTGISVGLVGLLIVGLLGLGGMLVLKWLGGGGQAEGITPGGQARTPTATKTATPTLTLIPTVTPTLVVAQASPTSVLPSPTPTTKAATMPETGEGPFMNLILGIGLASLMAAARMARSR